MSDLLDTFQTNDSLQEYYSIRTAVGIRDEFKRGKIKVTGKDRTQVLHNILSNDISALSVGEGCRAMLLTATAKVLADFRVFTFQDFLLLDVEESLADSSVELLDKYVITEDVSFENITSQVCDIRLEGPKTFELLRDMDSSFKTPLKLLGQTQVAINGKKITLLFDPFFGEYGVRLLIGHEDIVDALGELAKYKESYQLRNIRKEMSEVLRIEVGALRYGIDITEEITLPETGLEKVAASETKGCYPGQEVVAKVETYGRLHRKLTGLIFEEEEKNLAEIIAPGRALLKEGKEVGNITSLCYSPTLKKTIAIALVKRDIYETFAAQDFDVLPCSCRCIELPFIKK